MDDIADKHVEHLFLIIDDRLINEMPIIVTTNLDPDELGNIIGERVADRLKEACFWYKIAGVSRRGLY